MGGCRRDVILPGLGILPFSLSLSPVFCVPGVQVRDTPIRERFFFFFLYSFACGVHSGRPELPLPRFVAGRRMMGWSGGECRRFHVLRNLLLADGHGGFASCVLVCGGALQYL